MLKKSEIRESNCFGAVAVKITMGMSCIPFLNVLQPAMHSRKSDGGNSRTSSTMIRRTIFALCTSLSLSHQIVSSEAVRGNNEYAKIVGSFRNIAFVQFSCLCTAVLKPLLAFFAKRFKRRNPNGNLIFAQDSAQNRGCFSYTWLYWPLQFSGPGCPRTRPCPRTRLSGSHLSSQTLVQSPAQSAFHQELLDS